MSPKIGVLLCLAVSACVTKGAVERYVPPEEAAWFKFQRTLPEEGRETIPGSMANAVRLAAQDFFPGGARSARGADWVERCIRQPQAWEVEVAPWKDEAILVRFSLSPGACRWGGAPLLDMGATYAVDMSTGRILANSSALPQELPKEGLRRIEANTAAAIQFATDEFIDQMQHSAPSLSHEQACQSQLASYDVTSVSTPDGVVLVRFDINDGMCPPPGPPGIVEGSKALSPSFVTTYAIDIRTMRVLGVDLSTRQRYSSE